MQSAVGRWWSEAPRPLRLASAVLAASGAVDVVLVLGELPVSGRGAGTVAAATSLLVVTGLLGMVLAVLLLSASRIAWLLTVVLLVAGLTAERLDVAASSLAFIACSALVLVLLIVPGTLRAVWQRPDLPRKRHDLAVPTAR